MRVHTPAPADWQWSKVKHVAEFFTGWTPPTGNAESFEGENLWANISDLGGRRELANTAKRISDQAVRASSIKLSPRGSVLFSFKLSIGQVAFAGRDMYTNEAIATFPPQQGFCTRWAYYAFPIFIPQNAGENIYGAKLLNQELIRSADLLMPPRDVQERIVNFLDDKTARIDTLIAEKERLCNVLVEQRLSVAERVIDGSGGKPLAKLGFYAELLPGYPFASDHFSKDSAEVPLLRGVNVSPGRVRWDDTVYWPRPTDASLHRFLLREGDVVLGMDRPWISTGARVAMIDAASEGALLLQRVCRLRGLGHIHQRFIFYALASDRFRQSVEVEMTGVSVPHISPDQVLSFKIPVLSLAAQEQRCKLADEEISRIEQLVRHTTAMLDRLREYRSSLISAAVTGQLDLGAYEATSVPDLASELVES